MKIGTIIGLSVTGLAIVGGLVYVYKIPSWEVLEGGRVKVGGKVYKVVKGEGANFKKKLGIYNVTIANPEGEGGYIEFTQFGKIVGKYPIEI